ncbi:hypothetical protein [Mesorhizobium sp. RMAD-H1]|uniref:hypothetical protein n=1 Tax=Mesorhizobium sp. RMAD-H1 TaxID=2587065 RepID=UPI0016080731|nr:hypothetical protein [Mesorhizobium sp. RMAD-H1]MBB2970611.1 hypothetical protein [Mesorhizobium sp. RMAD-H1]
MSLTHNERIKLPAGNLERLSTAFIAVGVLGKTFDFTPGNGLFVSALALISWILAGTGMHIALRHILGRLKP